MSIECNFEWSDNFLLGFEPMDKTHGEYVELVAALQSAPDSAVLTALDAFIEHAEHHFAQERDWMESSNFPARDCHVDEHEKVMRSLRQVRPRVTNGNLSIARKLARELEKWFPAHADYMDSALAQWMVRKHFGGTPLVLRRNVTSATSGCR